MIKEHPNALNDINHYLTKVDNKCPESYYMRGLIKMELNDIKGACQDWHNADYLKYSFAKDYLKKYPQIKIKKTMWEKKLVLFFICKVAEINPAIIFMLFMLKKLTYLKF